MKMQNQNAKKSFASFCELFRLQAKANPSQIAAVFEENSLTYEELNHRSSQVANLLRTFSVKPETIVALSLYNGLDLLVGILGILQSGCAYLPIDPDYPIARIESILMDAKPAILLTDETLYGKFSPLSNNVVLINKRPLAEQAIWHESIKPEHLAYVIYTSGSTGRPKGIMMEHKALSHAGSAYTKLHPKRLISLMSGSISFDASLLVISHTLSLGGTVCIPRNEIAADPEQLIALIEKHKVNYTLCVPFFYSMLLNKSQKLTSLQCVDLGGDSIPNDIPALHAKIAPNAILHNVYGPSEYAVGATFSKIYDPVSGITNKISIGKPLPNTQVYILDENLKQVATGVRGEIFIGGAGLARGYLNNKLLSTEKFIFMSLPGQDLIRLYRTGDFGRFTPDGNIEFLGRMDHQVKIRGHRIELGELEYLISQYPEVNKAVVMAQDQSDGRKRIVAYFSTTAKEDISEMLQTHLRTTVPQYMVPSALIKIVNWPLTATGKIDRAFLSSFSEPCLIKSPVNQPLSELEQKLFAIWKQVLNQDTFGVNDNFFYLGGDSLLLVELQTLIQTITEIKINIADLFQYPTISKLAHHLSSDIANTRSPSLHEKLAKKQKSAFQKFRSYKRNGLK